MIILPIKGAQCPFPPQNNIQPECIEVMKVYDWTIISANTEQLVTVPQCCLQMIQNIKNLKIQCCPNTDPLPPSDMVQSCSIQRNVPGLPCSAALVTIRCMNLFKLLFFDGDNPNCPGSSVCCVEGNIPVLIKNVVVCLPEPLNCANIFCGAISCEGFGVLIDDQVEIDLTICMDIQVKLDVKLEVMAKFCQPRLPITPPVTTCPIGVRFPSQCPSIFPPISAACNCTGLLNASNSGVLVTFTPPGGSPITAIGEVDTTANICPGCQGLSLSSLSVEFYQEFNYPPVDGFTFNAVSFDPDLTCGVFGNTTTLSVTGTGIFTSGTSTTSQTFSLVLTEVASATGGSCSYTLTIGTDGSIVTLSNIVVSPCDSAHFFIGSC